MGRVGGAYISITIITVVIITKIIFRTTINISTVSIVSTMILTIIVLFIVISIIVIEIIILPITIIIVPGWISWSSRLSCLSACVSVRGGNGGTFRCRRLLISAAKFPACFVEFRRSAVPDSPFTLYFRSFTTFKPFLEHVRSRSCLVVESDFALPTSELQLLVGTRKASFLTSSNTLGPGESPGAWEMTAQG